MSCLKIAGWLFIAWFILAQIYSEARFWTMIRRQRGEDNPAAQALAINSVLNHVMLRVLTVGITIFVVWLLLR
jgi:hypothetical protein